MFEDGQAVNNNWTSARSHLRSAAHRFICSRQKSSADVARNTRTRRPRKAIAETFAEAAESLPTVNALSHFSRRNPRLLGLLDALLPPIHSRGELQPRIQFSSRFFPTISRRRSKSACNCASGNPSHFRRSFSGMQYDVGDHNRGSSGPAIGSRFRHDVIEPSVEAVRTSRPSGL